MNDSAPDLAAVTQVQQQIWSKGDFAMVASLVYNASESLAEELDLLPDERVLDVACGSGNAAISAARRTWGGTVGADYVPELLERGRERAAAERLEVEFVEADAQDLPFEDASFDVAISVFGAMFAPDQPKAAAELLRVVKPGGRIGMGNWTPGGAVGTMFQTIAKHAPPPPGLESPLLWGTEDRLRELFGDGISDLRVERAHLAAAVPLGRALHRVLPPVLRADPDGLRTGRQRGRSGPDRRPARLPRAGQHRRRAGDGARGRVPRGDRDARLGLAAARRRGSRRR